jgi:hypothetical protein
MRACEFVVEDDLPRRVNGIFPDGYLKFSDHYANNRRHLRRVSPEVVMDICRRASVQRPDFFNEIKNITFSIIDPEYDISVVVGKVPKPKYNTNEYVIITVINGRVNFKYGQPEVIIRESTDFTNAVNSIEKLIKQNNIEFASYEDLLRFVASRKFLQQQRNDQQFVNDVARSVLRRLHQTQLNEINDEDELSVSQRIQDYFTDRGYGYLGEGRDQIAFLSPRGTVVKVVGIGEDEREDIVKSYVGFFSRNQRNPHYPRIYNAGDFTVDGETYFVYEMEYLNPVSGEDRVLEYIEDLMSALPRGEQALAAFYKNKKRPPELSEPEVDGLVMATQDLEDFLGGQAPLDLRSIENLGRRKDGQIVIIDPFSL